ncbi:hypothetical protein GWI33_021562 [Rhynchophorus ferrugineus]|uniref:Uncharacterized protein n=1 Tax=Rhynchophorus ferrugineus TaxID=354439 RepID=A0A834MMX9_RHYFE|nr:hypothetical protein GWI33_021562 [Rhynchophorus ferrugineus]
MRQQRNGGDRDHKDNAAAHSVRRQARSAADETTAYCLCKGMEKSFHDNSPTASASRRSGRVGRRRRPERYNDPDRYRRDMHPRLAAAAAAAAVSVRFCLNFEWGAKKTNDNWG